MPVQETLSFTGRAGEYFRVWIVNLFLTIVTLGLYSPWAKVRKKRYLYGNTWLAGSNFDYHGDPVAILKGRLIAFAAFVAYSIGTQFSPRTGAILLLAMMPAIPWLILRSFAFNAANSSWRHLRMRFQGGYGDALKAIVPFLAIPIGTLLFPIEANRAPSATDVAIALLPSATFLAFYPYARARLVQLRLNGTAYGNTALRCTAGVRSFYGIYVIAAFMVFGIGLLLGFLASFMFMLARLAQLPELGLVAIFAGYMVVAVLVMAFTQSRTSNLIANTTSLGPQLRLRSSLSGNRLARLYGVNLLAILATAGLAIPWSVVRTLRYRAQCLAVEGEGSLDDFTSRAAAAVGATGEEMGDMFALDLSL
jgi:uncharacterized membrane protein YjgN (DUF898 family)